MDSYGSINTLRRVMNINPQIAVDRLIPYFGVERRRKPRVHEPFPVTVHGIDPTGESFEVKTVLENISAGRLYLQRKQRV